MGSLMIEENVVAEAGTVHYLTLDQIRGAIEELGYTPRQRNVFYQLIDPAQEALAIAANQARAAELQSHHANASANNIGAPNRTQTATPPHRSWSHSRSSLAMARRDSIAILSTCVDKVLQSQNQ